LDDRRQPHAGLNLRGWAFAKAIHPRAILAPGTVVGPGTQIVAGAIVNVDTVLGALDLAGVDPEAPDNVEEE
jgi:hypothetical protein